MRINAQRLWDSLMETARFGATPTGGITRLALTDQDKAVRDWFKAAMEDVGCIMTIDLVGNMFGRRGGSVEELSPIAIGSHLDTQPRGGKFDGILGVLGGLEVMRTLHEAGYRTHAPIEVINWTNEEGARFAPPMLASGVFANVFTTDFAYSRQDLNGNTFGNELYRIGYLGTRRAGAHKLAAMFELHIEQGPILVEERKTIGVVTGVQGMRWYEVTVSGQHAHAGATPMHLRRDALLGAARSIDRIDAVARRFAPSAVATIGLIECRPNSRNTIPGEIFFTVDLRHPEDAVLDEMESQMRSALRTILEPIQLTFDEKCIWKSPAVSFDPQLIQCVTRAAGQAGYPARQMVSGAGHDAVYIARVAPTAMIFVPCLNGLSHNEAESATFEDCAAGTQVLLNAVLDFDRHMGSS